MPTLRFEPERKIRSNTKIINLGELEGVRTAIMTEAQFILFALREQGYAEHVILEIRRKRRFDGQRSFTNDLFPFAGFWLVDTVLAEQKLISPPYATLYSIDLRKYWMKMKEHQLATVSASYNSERKTAELVCKWGLREGITYLYESHTTDSGHVTLDNRTAIEMY